jgi:methylase of polypeptide subunit release factors
LALEGGEGGMLYIEKIIRDGAEYLNTGGWLLIEMDPEQTTEALSMIEDNHRYGTKRRIKDYAHQYRVVVAQKKKGRNGEPGKRRVGEMDGGVKSRK